MSDIQKPAGGRSADLDLFKTLLVWGMITAHCIQLLTLRPPLAEQVISDFINLITFSGFLFAFGYGIGLSKSGGSKSWWQRLKPVLMLLAATYVSELAFTFLVDRHLLTSDLLVSVFSLSRLYGWSEFLASFFVLYLIIALIRPLLVAIASNWLTLLVAVLVCFASTWIVISLDVPLLATLVGTTDFASFPLLAYLPWFLVGIAFGRRPEQPGVVASAMAAAASAAFAYDVWHYGGQLPGRFPPTVLWVVGPALILLVYLASARWLTRTIAIPPILLGPGRHVLAALLISNLIIFSLRWAVHYQIGAWWWTPILAVGLIAIVTAWAAGLDLLRRGNLRRRQTATSSLAVK